MRIKKKNIREELDDKTIEKVDSVSDDATETIEKVAGGLAGVGVPEPENMKTAATLVTSVIDNEEVSEVVRPSMTKSELIETVLSKKSRKVVKTLKIKDLRK